MTRVKRGVCAKQKHKKILNAAKGYRGARSRTFKIAKQAVIKAHQYAYRDRKVRRREIRSLWITRINAALKCQNKDMSYSSFMHAVSQKYTLNRKMLAELAVYNPTEFASIVQSTYSN